LSSLARERKRESEALGHVSPLAQRSICFICMFILARNSQYVIVHFNTLSEGPRGSSSRHPTLLLLCFRSLETRLEKGGGGLGWSLGLPGLHLPSLTSLKMSLLPGSQTDPHFELTQRWCSLAPPFFPQCGRPPIALSIHKRVGRRCLVSELRSLAATRYSAWPPSPKAALCLSSGDICSLDTLAGCLCFCGESCKYKCSCWGK